MDSDFETLIDGVYAAAQPDALDPESWSTFLERLAVLLGARRISPVLAGGEPSSALKSCVVIEREPGDSEQSAEQKALLKRLTPHILRAAELHRKYERLRRSRLQFIGVLNCMQNPILLVREDGSAVFANAASEALLRSADGLGLTAGRIAATDPDANRHLTALIRAAASRRCEGGLVTIPRPSGSRPLILHVRQPPEPEPEGAEPIAALFITDPGAAGAAGVEAVAAAYSLTAAETRLLSALAKGDSLDAAAEKLAIARATARNQLAHIMQKTHANRQTELMRLVHASKAPLA